MNRRGFLLGMLAAGVAPAIVKAANLMPVFVRRESGLIVPEQFVITEVWYGGALLTPTMITREVLRVLEPKLQMLTRVGGNLEYFRFRVGDVVTFAR